MSDLAYRYLTGKMVRITTVLLMGVTLPHPAAIAASVTNRDERNHQVMVIEGAKRHKHVLRRGEGLSGICNNGCLIQIGDAENDPWELEGFERTSIEGGELWEDTEASRSEHGPAKNGKGSAVRLQP